MSLSHMDYVIISNGFCHYLTREKKKKRVLYYIVENAIFRAVSIVNTVTDGVARAMHGARLSFPEREKKSLARSYERAAIKKFPLEKKKSWWFL